MSCSTGWPQTWIVVEDDLEFLVLSFWDYRFMPPHPVMSLQIRGQLPDGGPWAGLERAAQKIHPHPNPRNL